MSMNSVLIDKVLDELGLEAALEWLIRDFSRQSGYIGTLTCSLDSEVLPPSISTCLFRITQEALTNILRHAEASQVSVRAWSENDRIHLRVEDNGIGITAERRTAGDTFGLLGMHERAALCGGHFMIDSLSGGGTRVDVHIPFTAREECEQ